jgi:hypothetical protein
MSAGPVGFDVEQQALIWAMWRRGDAIREMERTLVRRCRGSGGTCVNRVGCRRSRGGAESVICPWTNVRRSHAGSRLGCRRERSPGASIDRRRR